MKKNKLSVIIPFCQEWPQIAFTIRNIHEQLKQNKINHEIIAIDNWCEEVARQGNIQDRGSKHVAEQAKDKTWLKYIHYKDKLSHWNAKRIGVNNSSGDFLWFCDSHCIVGANALSDMFFYYVDNYEKLNGTINLPLTYHILEDRRLIYKPVIKPEEGIFHYTFTDFNTPITDTCIEVPVMSTCGMLISKQLYNTFFGWPEDLGIYGGGENFINYMLLTMGKKKWIYNNGNALHHHGEKRGYTWNAIDYFRNRLLAVYLVFGSEMADKFQQSEKNINQVIKNRVYYNTLSKNYNLRQKLKLLQDPKIVEKIIFKKI